MSELKVPSLQHLARNWHPSPERISRRLIALVQNSPTFSYEPIFAAVRDMLVLGISYETIVKAMRRAIRRADVLENFLGLLPLIRDHFSGVSPTFVQAVSRRFYPVGRDLLVPFDPPLIYGNKGSVHFPWFSFWRSNPLDGEALSLFVTMAEEMLLQDPDLEMAEFKILDFSAPGPREKRRLIITDAAEIPRLSEERKHAMLEGFAQGFMLAKKTLKGEREAKPADKQRGDESSAKHPDLFDDKPEP